MSKLFIATQHCIPQHFMTGVVYRLTRSRSPAFKNWLIGSFMRGFHPDMSDAVEPNPLAYASFNEFFTRPLRDDARPIVKDERSLISPVDGTVSQLGPIDSTQILQAKGRNYSLDALMAGNGEWAPRFRGGSFATLYLAPYNYHRIHMPLTGTLVAAWYVPGKLFSVNQVTAASVDNLFARNERVVCVFDGAHGPFVLALVGATIVGSMATVWHGVVNPPRPGRVREWRYDDAPVVLKQGEEMGRFLLGSTVVLLFPGALGFNPAWAPGGAIRLGEVMATRA